MASLSRLLCGFLCGFLRRHPGGLEGWVDHFVSIDLHQRDRPVSTASRHTIDVTDDFERKRFEKSLDFLDELPIDASALGRCLAQLGLLGACGGLLRLPSCHDRGVCPDGARRATLLRPVETQT